MNDCNLTLSEESFANLPDLEVLDIGQNSIELLPVDVFKNQIKMKRLDLGGNKIKSIPMELFSRTKSLEHLDLEQNQIKFLSGFVFISFIILHLSMRKK